MNLFRVTCSMIGLLENRGGVGEVEASLYFILKSQGLTNFIDEVQNPPNF
jgi:hypothetical protein